MIKKSFLFLFAFLMLIASFGQSRKGSYFLHPGSDKHALYVSFFDDDFLQSDNPLATAMNKIDGFQQLVEDYAISLERGIPLSDAKIESLAEAASKNSRNPSSIYKLKKIYKVVTPNSENAALYELAGKLEALEAVEYASLITLTPPESPYDIPPPTPDYLELQGYLDPDPGVDMKYAWSLGLIGENINVRNIEYGLNVNHEGLNERNIGIGAGMEISPEVAESSFNHGTAVFGIVYADDRNYGVTGMAHGASEMLLFTLNSTTTGYDPVNTISLSIEYSDPGDVIIYEMQITCNPDDLTAYVPVEYYNVYWDLTRATTDAGMFVVAAAGNGNQNLDDPYFDEYNGRGDSGAILVGAGTPNEEHAPLDFTTYGSRVDLQAWGREVLSLGYGTYDIIGDDPNQSYSLFSGTSAATPIVASCVIVLQSYYYSLTGSYMSNVGIRNLLVRTGIPQSLPERHIGPIPNMKAAIEEIQRTVCLMPINLEETVRQEDGCFLELNWGIPLEKEDVRFNIYKSGEMIAGDVEGFSYTVEITPNKTDEWCVETVCEDQEPKRVCIFNTPCDQCLPPNNVEIETASDCTVTLSWKAPEGLENARYHIFKGENLIAENITNFSYSSVVEPDMIFDWGVQTVCEFGVSEKIFKKNEICVVGIAEFEDNLPFTVYPNPIYDKITIELNEATDKVNIEFINMNGTIVHSESADNQIIHIPTAGLPKGIYLLKIQHQGDIYFKKVIKN